MPDPARLLGDRKQAARWLALLALIAVIAALRGATLLYDHSLHSIDGAMQTWFALDNFAEGKQLGTEFQSYLGIVMILALLPAFWAMGETLFASSMAAHLWVIIGAFASAYASVWLVRWIKPRDRWILAILLVFAFYYAGALVAGLVGLPYPLSFDPGVSLRPVRGLLPFLVLPFFVLALRRCLEATTWRNRALAGAALGVAAGLGLLWSNDAGIPLVIALVIGLASALASRPKALAAVLSGFAMATIATAAIILLIVTHGDPGPWLHYNFVAVAGDQFWYFAPWDRESRILGIADLLRIPAGGELLSVVSLLVLTGCVVAALVRRLRGRGDPVRLGAFIFTGSSLIGTALIPQLGGHIGGEYNHITFLLGMLAPIIVWQKPLLGLLRPVLRVVPPTAVIILTGLAATTMVVSEAARFQSVSGNSERSEYAPKLGFYVTPEFAADLAAMESLSAYWNAQGIAQDRQLLSVYTSALDIAAGADSPAAVGSLIHALGPENRAEFTAMVAERQVAAVTTIAPNYSGWEGWNRRANWAFFKALRENYRPIARTDQHILWVAGRGQAATSEARCELTKDAKDRLSVQVTSQEPGLASILLERSGDYSRARSSVLTVTEASPLTRGSREDAWSDFPRYGIANERRAFLSAPVTVGEATTLTLEMLGGSEIGSERCYASVYPPIDYAALPDLSEGSAAYLAEARP